jgi:hypothetical protein
MHEGTRPIADYGARRFELFIEYKYVSLSQSEHLFFHLFGKVTQVEPVYGQKIVMTAALSVYSIKQFTSKKRDELEYLLEKNDVILSLKERLW